MPGLDGAKVLRALQRDALPTKVLFLSAFGDPALVYEALEGGAAGFLSKDAERTEICEAVQRAARGETVLSPGLENGLAAQIRLRARDERPVLHPARARGAGAARRGPVGARHRPRARPLDDDDQDAPGPPLREARRLRPRGGGGRGDAAGPDRMTRR